MNQAYLFHSSSVQRRSFVHAARISEQEVAYAVNALYCSVFNLPFLNSSLDVDGNKVVTALSSSLINDSKLRCILQLDLKRDDAHGFALKFVKSILLSGLSEDLLGPTLQLTKSMKKNGSEAQIKNVECIQGVLRSRSVIFQTQVEDQLTHGIHRLPLLLAVRVVSLRVQITSENNQTRSLKGVLAHLELNELSHFEIWDILRAVQTEILQQYESGAAHERRMSLLTTITTVVAKLVLDNAAADYWDSVEQVVVICEESWVKESSIPTTQSPLELHILRPITQATLHLSFLSALLEESPNTESCNAYAMWSSVLRYVSFMFSKVVMCAALLGFKQYFTSFGDVDEITDQNNFMSNGNVVANQAVADCREALVRVCGVCTSNNRAYIVSHCVDVLTKRTLIGTSDGNGFSSSTPVPISLIEKAVRELWEGATSLPLSNPDHLFPQLLLAMCLSNSLESDTGALSSLHANIRVSLSQFPTSLRLVEALRGWAEADPRAALGLVADAVCHRLRRASEMHCKETDDGVSELRGVSFLVVALTQLLRDVAGLWRISTVDTLSVFTRTSYTRMESKTAYDEGNGSGVLKLEQRAVHDPHSLLRTAVFLTSLCDASEQAHVVELQQWLTGLFARDPSSVLLLVNDITFLGPILSAFSESVISERVSLCLNLLIKSRGATGKDNSYIIELLKTFASSLPSFLTATRHVLFDSKESLTKASINILTETPNFGRIDHLEAVILESFDHEENTSVIADLVCASSGVSGTIFDGAVQAIERIHVLNRLATLAGRCSPSYTVAAKSARSYLLHKSDFFDALLSGGTSQQGRCCLIFTSEERALCRRPSEPKAIFVAPVSAPTLEFLLSQHCAPSESTGDLALPWANWNDMTFCFLHALRSTVRVYGVEPDLFVADQQCVALLSAFAHRVSLPVVLTMLQGSLLKLLSLCDGEVNLSHHLMGEEPLREVLQKYICAALALLDSPLIPPQQTAQTLCGVFNDTIMKSLWRQFALETETFGGSFVRILSRALGLLCSKLAILDSKSETNEGERLEILTLSAPLLGLSATVARHFIDSVVPGTPITVVCQSILTYCSVLIAPIRNTDSSNTEYKYHAPVSLVSDIVREISFRVCIQSVAYYVSYHQSLLPSRTEVSLTCKKVSALETKTDFCVCISLCSLMSLLSLVENPSAEGDEACRDANNARSLSEAEFDAHTLGAVWQPALRGNADAWATKDFTLVQLLEEISEAEFSGDNRQFVAILLDALLNVINCWSNSTSNALWRGQRSRILVILLQILRSKSARGVSFNSSTASIGKTCLSAVVETVRNFRSRYSGMTVERTNVLLRRALRWMMGVLRFVDIQFVLSDLRASAVQISQLTQELENVAKICQWCTKLKEPIPTHARNLFVANLGLLVVHLLCSEKAQGQSLEVIEKQKMHEKVRASVRTVLIYLIQSAPGGHGDLMAHWQGLFLKYSIRCSTEAIRVLKSIIDGDEYLTALQAQVTAQHHASSPRGAVATTNAVATTTPAAQGPATTGLSARSDGPSGSVQGGAPVSDHLTSAARKTKRSRLVEDNPTCSSVLATPQSQPVGFAKRIKVESQPEEIPARSINTPEVHAIVKDTNSASSSAAGHASQSRMRANNSFLSAIMEMPSPGLESQTAVAERSTPSHATSYSTGVSSNFTTNGTQVENNANLDRSPKLNLDDVKTEPNNKLSVVTHVSKKFGGGF